MSEQCVNTGADPKKKVYQPRGGDLTRQRIRELPPHMRRKANRKLRFVIPKLDGGEHLSSADVARRREVIPTY